MISSLRFVKGAVSKKTLLPVLTSAHVYKGRVQASNGKVCIDAPCEMTQEFTVNMDELLRAIDCCNSEPQISVMESGLEIKSGKVKIKLARLKDSDYPRKEAPAGTPLPIDFDLISLLTGLEPYIGEDASRSWCCGIMFRDGVAWATNNATLVKYPVPECKWSFILPAYLVEELTRVSKNPTSYILDESALTVFYEDGSWISGVLLYGEWPPVERVSLETDSYMECTNELLEGASSVVKFCPDPKFPTLVLSDSGVETMDGDKGASFQYSGLVKGAFRGDLLIPVLKTATHIGFSGDKILFKNNSLQGALIGVRL